MMMIMLMHFALQNIKKFVVGSPQLLAFTGISDFPFYNFSIFKLSAFIAVA